MSLDTETTRVVFRRWRAHPRNIIALFPDVPHAPGFCMAYEHVGQHGGADYVSVIQRTRPASRAEYAPLQRELTSIGYNLKPIKRYTRP